MKIGTDEDTNKTNKKVNKILASKIAKEETTNYNF